MRLQSSWQDRAFDSKQLTQESIDKQQKITELVGIWVCALYTRSQQLVTALRVRNTVDLIYGFDGQMTRKCNNRPCKDRYPKKDRLNRLTNHFSVSSLKRKCSSERHMQPTITDY